MAFLDYAGLTRFKNKIKSLQTPVTSPAAEGSASAFIDTISQNAQGVVTATKKNVYGSDINMSSTNNQKVGTAVESLQNWKPSGNGTAGQVLKSNGNGTTQWAAAADQTEINAAVDAWMDANMSPNETIALDSSLTSTTSAAQGAAAGTQVLVSDTQPSAATNKIWIKNTPDEEIQVPTMDEFSDLKSAINSSKSDLSNLEIDDLKPIIKYEIRSSTNYTSLAAFDQTKKYAIGFKASANETLTKIGLSNTNAASGIQVTIGENVSLVADKELIFYNVAMPPANRYLFLVGNNVSVYATIYERGDYLKKSEPDNIEAENVDFIEKHISNLFYGLIPEGNLFVNNNTGAVSYDAGFFMYSFNIPSNAIKLYPYNKRSSEESIRSICFYDSEGNFISGVSGNSSTVANGVAVPSGAKTGKASLAYNTVDGVNYIGHHYLSTIKGNKNSYNLSDEIEIKRNDDNTRMACINFQFDDGHANDADIVTIFKQHSMTCGFALVSNITSTDITRYLGYQTDGFEMICHADSGTGMNDASVSPETIEARLATSKATLETAGFNIQGFVTPNSTMADIFKPILRKYYQWAETVYFGSYVGTGQPYMKPVDGVYNGWRVSLQTSTLANQKAAVDACIENYGCLTFYGHSAALDGTDYLTTSNLNELLAYIQTKVTAGKCIIGNPSDIIRNYFNVRNDDISDAWVSVPVGNVNLDSRLEMVGWDVRYNTKSKLFIFSARLKATEAISGTFTICSLPVHLVSNAFGMLVLNESGKNMMFYNNALISYTTTWASGTSYRISGYGVYDHLR